MSTSAPISTKRVLEVQSPSGRRTEEGTSVVSWEIYPSKDGWQTFSVTGQTVTILGVANPIGVSVITTV